jgi:hypothetical protein
MFCDTGGVGSGGSAVQEPDAEKIAAASAADSARV